METEDDFDKEMKRQIRAALPNPYHETALYPAPVTIKGVTRKFAISKKMNGPISVSLHQSSGAIERITRFTISRNGKTKWLSPLARQSDHQKFFLLANCTWILDSTFDKLRAEILDTIKDL